MKYIIISVFIILLGCTSTKYRLEKKMSDTLSEWGLPATVVITEGNEYLSVTIHLKGIIKVNDATAIQNFSIIQSTLYYKYIKYFENYKAVSFSTSINNYQRNIEHYVDEEAKKNIIAVYQNDIFYQNVLYCLKTFSLEEIDTLRDSIDQLVKKKKDYIKIEFWELLKDYSDYLYYCRNNSVMRVRGARIFIYLIWFVDVAKLDNIDNDKVFSKLTDLIKENGLPISTVNMKSKELEKYLTERCKNSTQSR